ncbi:2TM domain-containing protein [Flavobacterium sp.]|uniref:2TM domain-containing protein n=1 Tax=Flavobacterium sp. TaxID=239 RepID=UPI0026230F24|nr:2TM domain-containing protein [Flavobacterium sp.]
MEPQQHIPENVQKQLKNIKGFYGHLTAFCIVIPTLIAVNLWLMPEFQWFWFSLIGWGIGLFFHYLEAFQRMPRLMRDIEAAQMQKYTQGLGISAELTAVQQAEIKYEVEKKIKKLRGFYGHLIAYLIVNAIVVISELADGSPLSLGLFNLAIWWGFGLVAHAVSVFGANLFFNEAWERRKIEEFMKNSNRK